jgi:release factor glutamine methyltransferase
VIVAFQNDTSTPNKTVNAALREAAAAIAPLSDSPRLDAELLMAHALGISRSEMLMRQRDLTVPDAFAGFISRRMAHEPVAYITGGQAFWDLELRVTPDVLIPRSDSETLIEAAKAAFAGRTGPDHVLDLGTGSGALLLAALSVFPHTHGTGIDASAAALSVAQDNAKRLGFADRTAMQQLSWQDADWQTQLSAPFDLILCNPPYIEEGADLARQVAEYEPHPALFAGKEGLDDYRILLPALPGLLAPGGAAIFEIGHTQADSVSNLATKSGLSPVLQHDLSGNPRCLTLRTG